MENNGLLTIYGFADIFNISELKVHSFINQGIIPYNSGFSIEDIIAWVKGMSVHDDLKKEITTKYPSEMEAARSIIAALPDGPKLYFLHKTKNKKHGFLWYVRYSENGRLIPSQWSTGTDNLEAAKKFAIANRERLIRSYYDRKTNKKDFIEVLRKYYVPGSEYMIIDSERGIRINEKTRRVYHNFINKTLIPFLKERRIETFSAITAPAMADLQNKLLRIGKKPQTINRYMGILKHIIDNMVMRGLVTNNIFNGVSSLREKPGKRECYDIERVRGVFTRSWPGTPPESYMLCLMIYSTGLRNSEIEKLKLTDIVEMDDIRFINVRRSKTENGLRLVPLHDFVYRKIQEYAAGPGFPGRGSDPVNGFIFSAKGGPNQSLVYKEANAAMGKVLGMDEKELKEQNITFYSGRHFYKTVLNAAGLGDVEEYFMGHRVSPDVAKRYNHKDKQGRAMIIKKAATVLKAIDQYIFK